MNRYMVTVEPEISVYYRYEYDLYIIKDLETGKTIEIDKDYDFIISRCEYLNAKEKENNG